MRDLGFVETRPVQSAVIPLALNGADLIACAETGTGKTCAFVLPTLQRLLLNSDARADLKVGTTRDVVAQAFRSAQARRLPRARSRPPAAAAS